MCSHLTCKIRFEAPKRQQGKERKNRGYGKDAVSAKLIYNNVCGWSEHEISVHYLNR
ncbi:MAG TPA: hypothetical protein VHG34_03480 [Nitrososphaeraceae archaeon]|nr:hypothetical protein [Nitrososphaeraceae archaeon]